MNQRTCSQLDEKYGGAAPVSLLSPLVPPTGPTDPARLHERLKIKYSMLTGSKFVQHNKSVPARRAQGLRRRNKKGIACRFQRTRTPRFRACRQCRCCFIAMFDRSVHFTFAQQKGARSVVGQPTITSTAAICIVRM